MSLIYSSQNSVYTICAKFRTFDTARQLATPGFHYPHSGWGIFLLNLQFSKNIANKCNTNSTLQLCDYVMKQN